MGLLDDRVAVVTGSGRGIGRAIALCLAAEGARVVVNDIGVSLGGDGTDEDPAGQVVAEIASAGGEAVASRDRVDDFEGAGRIIGTAVDTFGKIDILVNNAGIVRDRTLVKMDEADYDAVVAVHQKGTFNTARHAAPLMKEAGYGRIVNITSSAGLPGQLRADQLRSGQSRHHGHDLRLGPRAGAVRDHRQRDGAGRCHPDDPGLNDDEIPPDQDPALNAPLVAFLASEQAADVNGQMFGRTGFGYTIFQTPRQVATMWADGGWTPTQVAEHFHEVLGQHLQPVGMPSHPLLGKKERAGPSCRPSSCTPWRCRSVIRRHTRCWAGAR